ncbi:hypothetical protein [Pseudomonas sp. LBUM920]|uniref:DUF7673 family protein n=1 Tax=Pseudomonas sp. LBUM920 TaxID=2126069 RepID=UPI000F589044|nr:hypothetical protein [Pseudomonas sp. LBUM920]AZF63803.1 hypothetical protein C4J83_2814 [Pseudomonas sp. LBUM920]
MSLTFDSETQKALEHLLLTAQKDTRQGRTVASFLFTLWNAGRHVRSAVADVWGLDPESVRACAQVFTWLNDNKVFPKESGCPSESGNAVQRMARWSMTLNRDLPPTVADTATADFALGLWNDKWLMSDEAVRCSYCLASQLPSNAQIPMVHSDGCEIGNMQYPLRELANILRAVSEDSP